MVPKLWKKYEFREVNFFVGVRVNSEQVPEDVVKFSFSCFVQDFNDESSEFGFIEESLLALIVFIKVDLELVPNGIHEGKLFFRDVSRGSELGFGFLPEVNSIAEVFLDEVEVLLEGNEAVLVSVKLIEDPHKVFSGNFESNEEAGFSDQSYELFQRNFSGFPHIWVGIFVASLEDNFHEINRKDDGDQLFEGDALILSAHESEVGDNDVLNFIFVAVEHFLEDFSDFINFKELILVGIVTEEDCSQLVHNNADESVPGIQIF